MSIFINHLAELAGRHKLVPFIGAGCSASHLNLDWNSLCREMGEATGSISLDNPTLAQEYVDKFGRKGLCDLLYKKLTVKEFEDNKGISVLSLISLNLGSIYTTNQDNVFEKCCEKYGRKFKPIVGLSDLAESSPSDRLYFKYHGDLGNPDSIVFTTKDYQDRIDSLNHFLNIRLRSDLLAKSILFIGYSFRDHNVQILFKELQNAFGGELPKSYLIARSYTEDLESLCNSHGIQVIDPIKETGLDSADLAFEAFMAKLLRETFNFKTAKEVDQMFRPAVPPSTPVVTTFEIRAAKDKILNSSFEEGYNLFRSLFDQTIIPKDYEEEVSEIFIRLAQKSKSTAESEQMKAALFNIRVTAPELNIDLIAATMATANLRDPKQRGIFAVFNPSTPRFPQALDVIAAAQAIDFVEMWGQKITDTFRSYIYNWVEHSVDLETLPEENRSKIRATINRAWNDRTSLEPAIARYERLKKSPGSLLNVPSVDVIQASLLSMMPRTRNKPYE